MKKNLVENTPRLTTNLVTSLGLGELESMDLENQKILLTTTSCNFGGKRYWFICPSCRARVANLFCPIGDDYYECRRCKGLRYELTIYRRAKHEELVKMLHKLPYGYLASKS